MFKLTITIAILLFVVSSNASNKLSESEFQHFQDSLDYYQFSYQVKKSWDLCNKIEKEQFLSDKQKTIINFYRSVDIIDLGNNSEGYILLDNCIKNFSSMKENFWRDRALLFYNRLGYFNSITANGRRIVIDDFKSYLISFENKYPSANKIIQAHQIRLFHYLANANLPDTDSLENLLIKTEFELPFFKAQLLGLKAEHRRRNKVVDQGINEMIKALMLFEELDMHSSLSYSYLYRMIGIALRKNNDLKLSRICHERQYQIAMRNQIKDYVNTYFVNGFGLLTWVEVEQGNYDTAWAYLEKVMISAGYKKRYSFLKFGEDHWTNDLISNLYLDVGEVVKATDLTEMNLVEFNDLLENREDIFSQKFILERETRYNKTLARCLLLSDQTDEAIDILELQIGNIINISEVAIDLKAELFNSIAEAHYTLGNYCDAAFYFELSLNLYLNIDQIVKDQYYFESIHGLCKSYIAQNDEGRLIKVVKLSLIDFAKILNGRLVHRAKSHFLEEISDYLQFIINHIISMVNSDLELLHRIIEFYKSIIHYHYLQRDVNKASNYEIIKLERAIFQDFTNKEFSSKSIIDSLKTRLIQLNLLSIQSNSDQIIPLDSAITLPKLLSGEIFINYFIDTDSLYALVHTNSEASLHKLISIDSFNVHTTQLLSGIYNYYHSCNKVQDSLFAYESQYMRSARYLYLKILDPIIKNADCKSLKISPINKLHYIPFESLVCAEGKYLIESYAIYYDPVSSSRKTNNSIKNKDNFYYAPSFESMKDTFCVSETYRNNYLGPLNYNSIEVDQISKHIKGKVYKSFANKDSFLLHAKDANIIHLATHGKIDFFNDNLSFLAFDNSQEDLSQRFYLREIEFSDFNINCLVLSSCESGLGNMYKGEGVRSLASRFLSSGVRSVVSTLWSVNDRSTSMIMTSFYKNLNKLIRKDQALRNAKLEYLANVDKEYRHPFYWSGIIAIGDMSPIPLQSRSNFPLYLLFIIPMIYLVYRFFNL